MVITRIEHVALLSYECWLNCAREKCPTLLLTAFLCACASDAVVKDFQVVLSQQHG